MLQLWITGQQNKSTHTQSMLSRQKYCLKSTVNHTKLTWSLNSDWHRTPNHHARRRKQGWIWEQAVKSAAPQFAQERNSKHSIYHLIPARWCDCSFTRPHRNRGRVPTLRCSIPLLIDIVSAIIPALLPLDILDSEQLYAENVSKNLTRREVRSNPGGPLR